LIEKWFSSAQYLRFGRQNGRRFDCSLGPFRLPLAYSFTDMGMDGVVQIATTLRLAGMEICHGVYRLGGCVRGRAACPICHHPSRQDARERNKTCICHEKLRSRIPRLDVRNHHPSTAADPVRLEHGEDQPGAGLGAGASDHKFTEESESCPLQQQCAIRMALRSLPKPFGFETTKHWVLVPRPVVSQNFSPTTNETVLDENGPNSILASTQRGYFGEQDGVCACSTHILRMGGKSIRTRRLDRNDGAEGALSERCFPGRGSLPEFQRSCSLLLTEGSLSHHPSP
jgi:hypothetical protein